MLLSHKSTIRTGHISEPPIVNRLLLKLRLSILSSQQTSLVRTANMKFPRHPSPLLLLLLPSLAQVLAVGVQQDTLGAAISKDTEPRPLNASPSPSPSVAPMFPNRGKGTKDAPVDGRDGKPHAGPFVDGKNPKDHDDEDAPAPTQTSAVLSSLKDAGDKKMVDGVRIPKSNDGVMDDPNRPAPKQGTTGTEGGVSEKDKVRKAQEGQTGERLEKKPDSPKEAPPLPHSEQERFNSKDAGKKGERSKSEKSRVEDIDLDDNDATDGLGGLEVINYSIMRTGLRADMNLETIRSPRPTPRHFPSYSRLCEQGSSGRDKTQVRLLQIPLGRN